jgi:quinol monooxygenase YgiN
MSITSIFEIHLPEASSGTYGVVHQVAAQTRSYAGNTGVQVLADHGDPTHVVVLGTWNSLAEFTAYEDWRAGVGAPVTLSALLTGPPTAFLYAPAAHAADTLPLHSIAVS